MIHGLEITGIVVLIISAALFAVWFFGWMASG